MDYPLHQSQYTDSSNHSRHHQQQQQQQDQSANYRTYSMYNERSDISSIMFDGNSPNNEEDDSRSSMMLLSTRPPHSIHDPWNQPQLHHQHHHQQHHSPQSSNDYRQRQPLQHHQIQQQSSHSERGIAGFVSKLYQCLQSVDSNQKYARWCQHDGKDMFIIDCIPEFTEFVLPRLFKHCKFPSFVRQLNIYGFQRDTDARKSKDTKDKESCRWYHPCFRPGRRDLFHLIRRKAARYSRKRKVKASNEEDPETILNLGSADESEIDEESQENMILLVNNNDEQEGRRSSSVSSVTQSLQHIDYNPASSQLQLSFSEPVTVATTTATTAAATNSPRMVNHPAMPLVVDTNINMAPSNDYHGMTTPTLAHNSNHNANTILQDDLSSDNADDRIINNGLVVSMQQQHHHRFEQPQQQQLHQPVMRDQELRMQLYHMKQQYEKMQAYFREQLSTAQIQIDKQQIRIQQLEGALGITKHPVKQGTIQQPATGGYMSTVCTTIPNSSSSSAFNHANYNLQQQRQLTENSPIITPRLVTSMYQMPQQSNAKSTSSNAMTTPTPRPNYYYHENASSPSSAAGNTNNNNTIENKSKLMAQIKNEIISSPSTPSTSSNSWLPYHCDSLTTNGMVDPANNVTAGSSTTPSTATTGTSTDTAYNTKLKPALPASSSSSNTPLIMHSNVHSTNNNDTNDNHDTTNIHSNNNKIDLMGHMHFNSFI
ncbi:heat shock factor protein 3-like [Mucor ambiguus]|uniref:Heat shock factor protein 3-like n=1 Tax=Mucor ambiguus TaxID=91626 RepID=A0A0C9MQ45_9FUNG|nr:heat shock factor protein 3-like [Mucor ambiguus]